MAKQVTAQKRQRRERGSINPDDIIKGAFELAEQVGIDNLSMPLLGKHLGVGVTSIYWYFNYNGVIWAINCWLNIIPSFF